MISRAALVQRLGAVEARVFARAPVVPSAEDLLHQAGMVPDGWQQQVLASRAPRLLLNCCRQSGKSTVVAALALHTALAQPGALVLLLSPSLRQSQELFATVRQLYRPVAGPSTAPQETALRLTLPHGARVIALPGTEQTVRGYAGVTLLVVDEAARVLDELYYAIRPMLAVSRGRLIALSTPWGKRGWFFHEWTQGEHWQQVCVTAEQCPRITPAFLEEERRSLPDLWYRSEYLCEFVDMLDMVFASADVEAALSAEIQPLFAR